MPTETNAEARRRERLEAAFTEEERRAQTISVRVLLAAFAIIVVWLTAENRFPAVLFLYPFIVAFFLIGAAPVLFWRHRQPPRWERYARFGLGVVLCVALSLSRNPLADDLRSPAMLLRWQNELYLFVFVAAAAFTYSPRVVLWTGVAAALAWVAGALWILSLPATSGFVTPELLATLPRNQWQAALMDPNRLFFNGLVRTVLVLVVVSGMLAVFVRRSRQIVLRQAEAERARVNLSRYFSPNMVEELAQSDLPLSTTRRQDAAVLFVDIVGFTAMSAEEEPERVIEMLRQFHQRVERAVFGHDGTLEKYIGDGAMATFGTPRRGECDATNALLCARALLDSMAEWNAERARHGQPPIRIGVGAHFGPIVMGDIGGEQRLEFAVVGDTVNVASRFERLTRELQTTVVVSGELIDAVQSEGGSATSILPGLHPEPSREVRGRQGVLRLWMQGADSTPRPNFP